MRGARADVVLVLQPALDARGCERAVGVREHAARLHEQVVILLREIIDLVARERFVLLRAVDVARRAHVLLPVRDELIARHTHIFAHGDDVALDVAFLRLGVVLRRGACDARDAAFHEDVALGRDDARAHVVLDGIGVERGRLALCCSKGDGAPGKQAHGQRDCQPFFHRCFHFCSAPCPAPFTICAWPMALK